MRFGTAWKTCCAPSMRRPRTPTAQAVAPSQSNRRPPGCACRWRWPRSADPPHHRCRSAAPARGGCPASAVPALAYRRRGWHRVAPAVAACRLASCRVRPHRGGGSSAYQRTAAQHRRQGTSASPGCGRHPHDSAGSDLSARRRLHPDRWHLESASLSSMLVGPEWTSTHASYAPSRAAGPRPGPGHPRRHARTEGRRAVPAQRLVAGL